MSMTGGYRRITPAELETIQNDEHAAEVFFGDDIDEEDQDACDAYYDALHASGRHLDIGKSWHALQFLLTGNPSYDPDDHPYPLRNAVMGGELTSWEAGYGATRLLTPQEVKDVSDALKHITREELKSRFDPTAFEANEIYPRWATWGMESLPWLLDEYDKLAAFFHDAATAGDAMLLSLD